LRILDFRFWIDSTDKSGGLYHQEILGQFEAEQRASQNIIIFSAIAFLAITVLMYLSVVSNYCQQGVKQ
jgi:Cu/Ag efflux pump CusA